MRGIIWLIFDEMLYRSIFLIILFLIFNFILLKVLKKKKLWLLLSTFILMSVLYVSGLFCFNKLVYSFQTKDLYEVQGSVINDSYEITGFAKTSIDNYVLFSSEGMLYYQKDRYDHTFNYDYLADFGDTDPIFTKVINSTEGNYVGVMRYNYMVKFDIEGKGIWTLETKATIHDIIEIENNYYIIGTSREGDNYLFKISSDGELIYKTKNMLEKQIIAITETADHNVGVITFANKKLIYTEFNASNGSKIKQNSIPFDLIEDKLAQLIDIKDTLTLDDGTTYLIGQYFDQTEDQVKKAISYIICFDGNGKHLWTKKFGNMNEYEVLFQDITLTSDDRLLITGTTRPNKYKEYGLFVEFNIEGTHFTKQLLKENITYHYSFQFDDKLKTIGNEPEQGSNVFYTYTRNELGLEDDIKYFVSDNFPVLYFIPLILIVDTLIYIKRKK